MKRSILTKKIYFILYVQGRTLKILLSLEGSYFWRIIRFLYDHTSKSCFLLTFLYNNSNYLFSTTSKKILSTKFSIPDNFRLISLPYSSIHKIRLITEPFPLLNIVSEHYFSAFIWFPKTIVTNTEKIDSFMNAINNIVNSNNYMKSTFAFYYQPSPAYQGIWPSLSVEQEFARQGLMSSNSNWKVRKI